MPMVHLATAMKQLMQDLRSRDKPAYADHLRRNQTPSERMMGRVLVHLGIQAEPQVIVRGYIADWVDEANKVIFEVGGGVHLDTADYDALRDAALEDAGYRVMRFTNEEVIDLMVKVAAGRDA